MKMGFYTGLEKSSEPNLHIPSCQILVALRPLLPWAAGQCSAFLPMQTLSQMSNLSLPWLHREVCVLSIRTWMLNTQGNLYCTAQPLKQNPGVEPPLLSQIPNMRMQIDTAMPQTLQIKAQLMI